MDVWFLDGNRSKILHRTVWKIWHIHCNDLKVWAWSAYFLKGSDLQCIKPQPTGPLWPKSIRDVQRMKQYVQISKSIQFLYSDPLLPQGNQMIYAYRSVSLSRILNKFSTLLSWNTAQLLSQIILYNGFSLYSATGKYRQWNNYTTLIYILFSIYCLDIQKL